jgi:predicted dinucleotide-binding enzyme
MKIAILGAGNVGGALARGWAKAGHHIFLGVRDASAEKVQKLLRFNPNIKAMSVTEAVQNAEAIMISLPIPSVVGIAKQLGNLKDKIIIDATNAISQKPDPYPHTVQAFKELTACPNVVKCFNNTGFENMENPLYGDIASDMFVAGDSAKGKEVARQLSSDLGFAECYDFGGDDKIPLLEQVALTWVNLAIFQKEGRNIAFKVLKR